ncbi:MAG: hypothetical protein GX575_15160 [Candidatus Anammoximicrobium sp.]|nr:hypothetical protein [Candidatus Anammoximicrobium sp.]
MRGWLHGDAEAPVYEALRPDIWKQSHPEVVRAYRVQEHRDRADRQRFYRAQRRIEALPHSR